MNNSIEWNRVKETPNDDEIKAIEGYFNIRFPKDYITCAKINNGGRPKQNCFKSAKSEEVIKSLQLLSYNDDYGIIKSYESAKGIIPDDIVPFADDPFGNMICFDYRESKSNPKIVFWDYERACIEHEKPNGDYAKSVTYVCDSFSDLLDMLHEYEEE